ncbi:MAG: type II toxin-antitoxin system VapC family toxin [Planctomycetia bacterium]|nr:type II toxin-antitoxin system VapC family toxin [Planctomycetia bacterium]
MLDTDVLTLHQCRKGDQYARLEARLATCEQEVYVTIVSFEEQMRGWMASCAKAKKPEDYATATRRLNEMLEDFGNRAVLLFDDRAVAEFKRLKAAKVRIGTMDLRIASIVLANSAILITRNLRDYEQVPGLQAEDWTT